MKFEEVLKLNDTLKKIIDDKQLKLNVLLKFRLLGIMKSIEPHITNFEIIKNEKIIEYGKKNKNNTYQIHENDTNALNKFRKSLEQVLKSNVTINLELLNLDEVFNCELRSDYLMGLYPIIRK